MPRRRERRLQCCVACCAALCCGQAHALILYVTGSGARSVTLTVGSNDSQVNKVSFDVVNAALAPGGSPVTGFAGGGAPPTTPSGGVLFEIRTNRRGSGSDVVRLSADSASPLACVAGDCLGTGAAIPFTSIGWRSYEPSGAGFAAGIASGTFSGSAGQLLFAHTVPAAAGDSLVVRNVLVFDYANTTLYPSGTYAGRVTYTLTVP